MLKLRMPRRDEQGSIVVAVTVIMIATMLMITTLAVVYSGMSDSRKDQNRTNAFQFANAGIDQALQRIDTGLLPLTADGNGYTPILNAGGLTGFTQTLVVNGSEFVVTATMDPPGQTRVWKVQAIGEDESGQKRQAIATIEAEAVFSNGFFTLENFRLSGNQLTPIAYDSRICADATCETKPAPTTLGTNGSFWGAEQTVKEFAKNWQGFDMYGRATQTEADYACAEYDCGTAPKVIAHTNRKIPWVPTESQFAKLSPYPTPPYDAPQPCPNGGVINGGTLAPGNYVCDNLSISGTVSVSTDVDWDYPVRFYVRKSLSFASGSLVNFQKPTPWLQFYQPDSPDATGSICGAEVWAVLDTPGLPIECSGTAQPRIFGAVTARIHGGTGNHFDFHWDIASFFLIHTGKYVLKDWRECPVGLADC